MPAAALLSRAVGVLRAGWRGLVGQCLTFSAMLLPLFFREFDGIAFQIVAGAGAGVMATFFTLSFSSVFPRIVEQHRLRRALWSTLLTLALGATVLVLVSLGARVLGLGHMSSVLLGWAVMGSCQGLYMIGAGSAVRFSHYAAIATGRLVYGAAMFVGALASCVLFSGSTWALTLSACGAQLLAATGMWASLRSQLRDLLRVPSWGGDALAEVRGYVVETGPAAVSTTLTGLSGVINVFILPALGVFHNAWTTLLRLTGGVMTVSLQLVSPAYDAQLGERARDVDREGASHIARRQLVAGLAIAAVTVVVSLVAMYLVKVFHPLTPGQSVTVVVLAIVYILSGIGISVMTNTLILIGGDAQRLAWAAGKTVVMVLAIILGGAYVLHATVMVEAVSAVVYAVLVRHQLKGLYIGSHRRSR